MKFSNLILVSFAILSPFAYASGEFEIIDGNAAVTGKPNASQAQARENWEAACEQWKNETKDLNRNDQLMMISCDQPTCNSNDGIFTCTSNASFKVKTAGTRVQSQPAVTQAPVYTTSETVVDVAPPPVIVETVPAPRPGFIWITGYWGYRDHHHYWINGHFESHRAGYVYISPRWVSHGRSWHFEHGYWRR